MASKCPLALPGTTVAVGLPKIVRSVWAKNTTFSWQVPTTEMELGPIAGSDAMAAVIVVNAPGVAPEQSTTAPAAKAAPDIRTRHTVTASNLSAEAHCFMVFLSLSACVSVLEKQGFRTSLSKK